MCSRILRVDCRTFSINSSNTSAVHEQRSCHSSSVDSTSFFKPSTYLHRVSHKPDYVIQFQINPKNLAQCQQDCEKKSNRIAVTPSQHAILRCTLFQTFHHRRPSFSGCRLTDLELTTKHSRFGTNTAVVPAPIENFFLFQRSFIY